MFILPAALISGTSNYDNSRWSFIVFNHSVKPQWILFSFGIHCSVVLLSFSNFDIICSIKIIVGAIWSVCLVLLFGVFLDIIDGKSINSTALLNVLCSPCFCQTGQGVWRSIAANCSGRCIKILSTALLPKVCKHYGMPIVSVGMATQYFAGQALVAEHSLKLPNLFREQYLNKPSPCLVHHAGHKVFVQPPIFLAFVIIPARNVCFGKVGAPLFHYISNHLCWLQKQVSA